MSKHKPKTICFFNSNRAWGGGEKWHFTTAAEFIKRGHNVFLVTNVHSDLAKKAIQEKLNVFSFYVHNLSFLNPFKLLTLMTLFKSQKLDAIVLNLPSDLKLAGLAAKLAGVKNIIYRRGMPHPLRNTWLNRFLFKKVLTHVVINSQEIGRSLTQGNEEWFPNEKMVLIYNGIDTSRAIPHNNKFYSKKEGEFVIGNAGRLTEQKGQKYLIDLAEILLVEGLTIKILIAGEGELREELQGLIDQRDLSDEVKLLGHVNDMVSFFNSLDVFVFTSLYEGSANTLIETLNHGLPCVAFDISSNPEIIEHEVNGLLAGPFDVDQLADLVRKIATDQNMRRDFQARNKTIMKEKFDSALNLERLEAIIS